MNYKHDTYEQQQKINLRSKESVELVDHSLQVLHPSAADARHNLLRVRVGRLQLVQRLLYLRHLLLKLVANKFADTRVDTHKRQKKKRQQIHIASPSKGNNTELLWNLKTLLIDL